jgi:3-methylcrotonyl-CoA carboxylase alpha subunit
MAAHQGMAELMTAATVTIARVGPGTFLVSEGDQRHLVHAAGPPHDRWAFWNGEVFRSADVVRETARQSASRKHGVQYLSAPMPATVIRVLVVPGSAVEKGDVVAVVEAMKMELPIRAPSAATVIAVRCREGERVEADQILIDLE